ncbi:YlmC/YmxH family sporulation protein [uncultured Intestinimonas sp.]|uniref:YlmC/YmxH family sporulation protein n=1 Tax=uncultured Intestinimonas sp. TaxID=1689265 RepID=UPI00345ACCB9
MESRVTELRDKEIINISDGCRFGYVGDVEVDLETGQVKALVVPGRLRFFGLLGREEDKVFPWESVRRFGEDIILVEAATGEKFQKKGKKCCKPGHTMLKYSSCAKGTVLRTPAGRRARCSLRREEWAGSG